MESFGELLRFYRQRSSDPDRPGRALTQARLGELMGNVLGDSGYTGAAISEWERNRSNIDKDHRAVLVALITVLHSCGGLKSPVEADEFLWTGNYRELDDGERAQIFAGSDFEEPVTSTDAADGIVMHVVRELVENPHLLLNPLLPGARSNEASNPTWTQSIEQILTGLFRGWSSRRVLGIVFTLFLWLLLWQLALPLLRWPPATPAAIRAAAIAFIISAVFVPVLLAVQVYVQESGSWPAGRLRFFFLTFLGALAGFHLGYLTLFFAKLSLYYLTSGNLARDIIALFAFWPLLSGYVMAVRFPKNRRQIAGSRPITEREWSLLFILFLFGPLFGWAFRASYAWLLSPPLGVIFILVAIGTFAALSLWQRRSGRRMLLPAFYALLVGAAFVWNWETPLQQLVTAGMMVTLVIALVREQVRASTASLFVALLLVIGLIFLTEINPLAARLSAIALLFVWIVWGRKAIWFPLPVWGVAIAAVGALISVRQELLSDSQASVLFIIAVPVIHLLAGRLE